MPISALAQPEHSPETRFTLFQWIRINLFHQARNRNKQRERKAEEMRCFGYTTSPEDDGKGTLLVVCQFWPCFYEPVLALFLAVSRTVGGTGTVGLLGREPEQKYISRRGSIGLNSLSFLQVMHVYRLSVGTLTFLLFAIKAFLVYSLVCYCNR